PINLKMSLGKTPSRSAAAALGLSSLSASSAVRSNRALASSSRASRSTASTSDPDRYELASRQVEPLEAIGGADHDVFDPGAVRARIDAGLDRERVAWPQRLGVTGDDVRVFVRLQPDPVPRPVHEVLAVPGRRDRLPRGGVDSLGTDSRADRGTGGARDRAGDARRPVH